MNFVLYFREKVVSEWVREKEMFKSWKINKFPLYFETKTYCCRSRLLHWNDYLIVNFHVLILLKWFLRNRCYLFNTLFLIVSRQEQLCWNEIKQSEISSCHDSALFTKNFFIYDCKMTYWNFFPILFSKKWNEIDICRKTSVSCKQFKFYSYMK